MWSTVVLSLLAGVLGVNAVPHFVKGMIGEEFPNVTGNAPVRNAVAGFLGLVLTALIGYWADLSSHPWPGVVSIGAGGLAMAVFHGLGGAYRLNTALGLPNPPRPIHSPMTA
ncbi:hypothetical protein AB4305_06415 [Nocardia sp. 2YAB30]|uniref:hypothetical protein n=1 Tax=unclassified Nocardia TaxID=2637762 RepID=UPI003F9D5D83